MTRIILSIASLTVLLIVGGCQFDGKLLSFAPVCEALGDPIEYNSTNPKSAYHAGPALAPRLQTQNQVGVNLNCPEYK